MEVEVACSPGSRDACNRKYDRTCLVEVHESVPHEPVRLGVHLAGHQLPHALEVGDEFGRGGVQLPEMFLLDGRDAIHLVDDELGVRVSAGSVGHRGGAQASNLQSAPDTSAIVAAGPIASEMGHGGEAARPKEDSIAAGQGPRPRRKRLPSVLC